MADSGVSPSTERLLSNEDHRQTRTVFQECGESRSDFESCSTTSGYSSTVTDNMSASANGGGRENKKSEEEEEEERRGVIDIMDQGDAFTPPDGGVWACVVVLCASLCNGVVFSILNSFGVLFIHLKELYGDDPDSATKASLVGSVAVGTTFALSPVSGILADKLGIRLTVFLGSLIAALGMLASSFLTDQIIPLYLTYGVLFGAGATLTYTPSLAIIGHYYKRHIGLANGLVAAGSSVFSIVMPLLLQILLDKIGLANTLRCLAGLIATLTVCALSFKPLMPKPVARPEEPKKSCVEQIVHVDNWRNKKYVIWALSVPSALFGYFVPFVHIVKYAEDMVPDARGGSLLTCIAVTSLVGRLVCGKLADHPRVNRIFLQQISFVAIGLCTMLLTTAPYFGDYAFGLMMALSLVMGFFDGCFITMFGPIAFEICGPVGAAQGIGFILGLCSIPLTVGPPVAGWIYDRTGKYTASFLAAGVPPIIGALFMFCIYRVKSDNDSNSADSVADENGRAGLEEGEALIENAAPSAAPASKGMTAAETATTIVSCEKASTDAGLNRGEVREENA